MAHSLKTTGLPRKLGLLRRKFRRLLHSERGAVAIVMALSLPLIMAFVGFGGESGYWYLREAQLQGFADSAAFAGGHELISGGNLAVIEARSQEEASRAGLHATRGTTVVNSPPTSGAFARDVDAVEVIVTEVQPRLFTSAFLDGDVPISTRSVVQVSEWEDACVLTLDPSSRGTITTIGSADVTLDGCAMMSNSIHDEAFVVAGASDLTTSCIVSAGGATLGRGVEMTDCARAQTGVKPALDPFAELPEPIPGACQAVPGSVGGAPVTLSPGTYCGNINLTDDYELDPGIYIFDGGQLTITGTASFIGDEVMLAFLNGAGVTMNGGADVQLSAQTTGIYAGILIFGDRDVDSSFTINGNADSKLEGAIYVPKGDVAMLGSGDVESDCLVLVSETATFSGDVQLSNDCDLFGLEEVRASGILRIVE